MKTRNVVILGTIVFILGIAGGRYLSPKRVEEKVVERVVKVKEKVKENNLRTEITETIKPDGSKEIKTVITDQSKTTTDSSTKTDKESSKVVVSNSSPILINALGAIDINNPAGGFVFGIQASKQLLGPLHFGAFGFTDGRAGISVGISF